jgi:hypothetical protein
VSPVSSGRSWRRERGAWSLTVVDRKFMGAEPDTAALRERHEQDIARAETRAEFEDAMNRMLRDLGASHVGFFHEATPHAAGRIAIAARSQRRTTPDGARWVFQDVPPAATPFALGESYVRILIHEIIVDIDDTSREILLVMHWQGGRHTEVRVARPWSGRTKRYGCGGDRARAAHGRPLER